MVTEQLTKQIHDKYNGAFIADLMSIFLNNMSSRYSETGEKLFLDSMAREHRSLQQKFTSLCIDWLRLLSERNTWDLRNEASVMLAKDLFSKINPDKINAVRCQI